MKLYSYEEVPLNTMTFVPSTENKTGGWRTLRPVIDYDKCVRCMNCWKFCPDAAISMVEDYEGSRWDRRPEINYDYCKGCGICFNECPVKAIEMAREE